MSGVLIALLLLLLLKEVDSAGLRESDVHPISPKIPAPQYQPIDRKNRKGKRVEAYSRDRAAYANKEALAHLPIGPTPSNKGVSKIVPEGHRGGNKSLAVRKVLQRGGA